MTKMLEGFSHTPYQDTRGYWTIGYGFKCDNKCPEYMTREEADKMMEREYKAAVKRARDFSGYAWGDMSMAQKMVITDMAFNLGNRIHEFKRLKRALLLQDREGIIREMKDSKWYTQTGRRPKILINLL